MKKIIATSIVLIGITGSFNSWAIFGVGDVVFDPTAVGQAVIQVEKLAQQYEQYKALYESMTGIRNVSDGIHVVNDILPGTWQSVVQIQNGAYGSKQAQYDALLKVISDDELKKVLGNTQFKNAYETVRVGMAVTDVSYGALSEHTQNLKTLYNKINLTKDVKEATDLGNQIQIELAFIEAINAKTGTAQTNLTSVQASNTVIGAQQVWAWNK